MKTPSKIATMLVVLCTSAFAIAQTAPAQQGQGKQGMQHGAQRGAHGGGGGGMTMLDTDKDGSISKAEFDAHFKAMDKDADGKISATEQQAYRDAMRTQMRTSQAGKGGHGMGGAGGTCRADADKDGVVSRAEAEKMGPQALSRFDAADTNKDGKLDAAEMAARCGARPS